MYGKLSILVIAFTIILNSVISLSLFTSSQAFADHLREAPRGIFNIMSNSQWDIAVDPANVYQGHTFLEREYFRMNNTNSNF